MSRRIIPILAVCLMTASSAHAQYGGGGGGGVGGSGHGGGHRGGGKRSQPDSTPKPDTGPAPNRRETPLNKVEIVGVIKAIDPANDRITIAYDEVDALNWPAGTMPFVVSKTALLNGATVGEKVRFRIESQQISDLAPYSPPAVER